MSSLIVVNETIAEFILTDNVTKNIFERYKDVGYRNMLEQLAIAQTKRAIDAEARLLEMIKTTPINFAIRSDDAADSKIDCKIEQRE